MSDIYINIGGLPRVLSLTPKIHSISNKANHPFMKRQVISGLQVCIRFHGTPDCARVNVNGKDYHAKYPLVLIKREGELHQIADDGAADSFYFTYAMKDAPLVPAGLVISEIQVTSEIRAAVCQVAELLSHCCEQGVSDRIDGLCLQLLINLLLQCGHHEALADDAAKIQRISSYLRMHLAEDINFNDIAQHFAYSPRSFYRHWQQYHGESPANYVLNLKLAEAKQLLTESDLSVEAISERLRYNSSAYFVYIFRKRTGMTPLQYRKRALA